MKDSIQPSVVISARLALLLVILAVVLVLPVAGDPAPTEGSFVVHNFHFQDGETLPELRVHYATLGAPERDSSGRVTNAVLIQHGTTGSWRQFMSPLFADVLFGHGQLLDTSRYYIITLSVAVRSLMSLATLLACCKSAATAATPQNR